MRRGLVPAAVRGGMMLGATVLGVTVLGMTILGAAPAYATLQGGRAALDRNDYDSAQREFTEAAQGGNADAQYELGNLYYLGRGGIPMDPRLAATWFARAADQGQPQAQVRLADMTARGVGVPQDYDRARQLLRAALPRLRDAERRAAEAYAVRIDAYLQARATQPATQTATVPSQNRPRSGSAAAGSQSGQQGRTR